jgi:hypothetical protein
LAESAQDEGRAELILCIRIEQNSLVVRTIWTKIGTNSSKDVFALSMPKENKAKKDYWLKLL